MSHDTHDSHGHHHDNHNDKPVIEFKAAFYFVLILAGLFIAGIGFVQSMDHTDSSHDAHGASHTEVHGSGTPHHDNAHDTHATPAVQQEAAPAQHH